jgi:acetoacetyl-CoA reductase
MWLDRLARQGVDYWVRAAGMGFGSAIAVAELGERLWEHHRAGIDLAYANATQHHQALAALLSPIASCGLPARPRLALVTGARGALGTSLCEQLKRCGFRVAATYPPCDAVDARQWRHERQRGGYDIAIAECDLGRFEDCARLARWAERRYGAVDILVHCIDLETHDQAEEHWRSVLDDGLDRLFNLARNLIPGMSKRGDGRIIIVSGGADDPHIAAARAGILGFTRSLAREVRDQGITVNTVSAGCSVTAPGETSRAILSLLELDYLDRPEEITKAVAFLAADEHGGYTGIDVASQRQPALDRIVDLAKAKRRSCDRLLTS